MVFNGVRCTVVGWFNMVVDRVLCQAVVSEVMNLRVFLIVKNVGFIEGVTKCSNEVYNKFTKIRQHNSYLLGHISYMFRPVNRSSSGLMMTCTTFIGTYRLHVSTC